MHRHSVTTAEGYGTTRSGIPVMCADTHLLVGVLHRTNSESAFQVAGAIISPGEGSQIGLACPLIKLQRWRGTRWRVRDDSRFYHL